MAKKVIIKETHFKELMMNQLLEEANLTKTDIANIVRDTIKSDAQTKKNIEKQVKELVASAVNMLFKTLWQRRNFYEDEIKK
jgi:hypothetical protein